MDIFEGLLLYHYLEIQVQLVSPVHCLLTQSQYINGLTQKRHHNLTLKSYISIEKVYNAMLNKELV